MSSIQNNTKMQIDPYDTSGIRLLINSTLNQSKKTINEIIKSGNSNLAKYSSETIAYQYLNLYQECIKHIE
jgi:citrate lyase gamma subunit